MHRWKFSALAAAAFVSAAMTSTDAAALALGSVNVHSALGETLKAEITVPQITAAEMDSLLASIASPEVFRAQGMSYTAAARSIRVNIKRNPDGTATLQLSSSAPIDEPFLDLVLETNWNSGHLVRNYTLLLDPPVTQRRPAAVAVAPQVPVTSASVTGRSISSSGGATRPLAAPAAPTTSASAPAPEGGEQLRVRTGDTAGKIANNHLRPGVSLDQMLVAMLRHNPSAFINGNVNRIRAGAVVQLPSREQALETPVNEARSIVAAQSRDFNAYRRSLASKAPAAPVQAADRTSGGQVQAHVQDASPSAANTDKLTLTKGAVQATAAQEAQLAQDKQTQDQSNRLNELQRNLAELNELAKNSGAATPAPADAQPVAADTQPAAAPVAADTAAVTQPTLEVSNPAALPATASTPENGTASIPSDNSTEAAASTPATETTAAPEPAPKPKPKPAARKVAPPPPPPEPTLMEELMDNPLVPAGGAVLALLLGLLGYRTWQRRKAANAVQDPALQDSQLHPDSFFGGSGGQQVDTSSAEGATTMAYSPSQLDGSGDIDPVAEADVYLSLGRDVQAEEILKEALRDQPDRLPVHMKLAEVYVKRQDGKGLEQTARKIQELSQSQGSEWKRVVNMGRAIDPTNPFYAAAGDLGPDTIQPKPSTSFADALQNAKPQAAAATVAMAAATDAGVAAALPPASSDFDLNLDLDLPEGLTPITVTPSSTEASAPAPAPLLPSDEDYAALEQPVALDTKLDLTAPHRPDDPPTLVADTVMPDNHALDTSATQDAQGLDFDLSSFMPSTPEPAAAPVAAGPDFGVDLGSGLDFNIDTALDTSDNTATAPVQPAEPASTADAAAGLNFDLGALDLDLGSAAASADSADAGQNAADDPLSTKLDLAQEFNTIGDSEGARALIEEVLAEASGVLKVRAQKMLSELD